MAASSIANATVDLRHCGALCDRELTGCTLKGFLGPSATAGDWHRIERVRLAGSTQVHLSIATAHFRDVRVDGMRRGGRSPLYLWSPLFERVVLSGQFNGLKINPECEGVTRLGRQVQADWLAALKRGYEQVDWALDVRDASFSSAPTLEAVPGSKVRFNPDRHALVRRASLAGVDLPSLPRRVALDWFVRRSPFDDVVLLSRDEPRYRDQDRDDLKRLRDLGIAD